MRLTSRRHSSDVYSFACRRASSKRIKSCLKLLLSALVILLGVAASSWWSPVLSWPSPHSEGITVLKGRVLYIDFRDPDGKSVYVIAKREDKSAAPISIPVDDEGAFKDEMVPPGVYSIFIKGVKDAAAEAAKYEVLPHKETSVELNWTDHLVYCTESTDGKRAYRVTPTGLGKFDKERLHRPKYELFKYDDREDNKPLNAVIEYCRKEDKNHLTIYESARLISGADAKVFADNLRLNRRTHEVAVINTEVTIELHKESFTFEAPSDESWTKWWTIGNIKSAPDFPMGNWISGEGSIRDGGKTIRFSIDTRASSFHYTDGSGLKLSSTKDDCKLTIQDEKKKGTVTFTGTGTLTGTGPYLKNRPIPPKVEFSVTFVNNGRNNQRKDSFSIRIHDLKGYRKSGLLVSGDIDIRAAVLTRLTRVASRK